MDQASASRPIADRRFGRTVTRRARSRGRHARPAALDGIDLSEFREHTGFDLRQLAPESLSRHLNHGFLEEFDGRVRLTREGRFVADTVIVDFL